jgi:arylsulfatase A-like enzyme
MISGSPWRWAVIFFLALTWGCVGESGRVNHPEPRAGAEDARPNVLLIVADDLGYGDLGAFGGEIETPAIDSLAREGARFTSFYTQVSCSPTRSMLLTGVDNHLNGLGTMAEDLLPHHQGVPGYEGYLNDRVVTIATLLQDAGYHTYMTGKWHLGLTPETDPHRRGFEKTYALLKGGGNHFNDEGMTARNRRVPYSENGQAAQRPEGIYSSDLFTGKLMEAMAGDHGDDRPFFALLSFTAPHFPLQAPPALIEKYSEHYKEGWDVIRLRRFQRLQEMGLVPSEMTMPPRIEEVPDWEDLTALERQIEAKKMAIYAAMVENLDTNVGRVLGLLDDLDIADNTLVLFMSDNGTDPYDRNQRPIYASLRSEHGYDNSLENMGKADSFIFYGLGWAQVGSVHHRHYKFLPSEGGMHAPMLLRYPEVVAPGTDRDAFITVLDIVPTVMEMAGVAPPGTEYQGRPIHSLRGRSFLPYLRDPATPPHGENEPVAFEIFGHGVVYMGRWKAIRLRPPWEDGAWRLHDLSLDPGEEQDLALEKPELLAQMVASYDEFARANGVIHEPPGITAYPYKPGHLEDLVIDD